MTAVITTNRLCGILTSVVSVLVFNFFFTTSRLTFHFDDPNYIVTFAIMFMVTLLSSSLATHLKENAKQSAHTLMVSLLIKNRTSLRYGGLV